MNINNKFKKQLISRLIKDELGEYSSSDKNLSFKKLLSGIYTPSLKSFLFILFSILVLVILGYLVDRFLLGASHPLPKEGNLYQNLIAIHAGIGTIIFALVIFVAESLRDDETKDKARVLLKESFLFPLVVAEILAFFIFVLCNLNFWILAILIVGIGLLTIASLYKTILVLLNKYRFAQKRSELLQERLLQSVDLAIEERIGNNILLSRLNNETIKLLDSPFPPDNESDYYSFNAKKTGIVSDLDLGNLMELADTIEANANENGFSFSGTKKHDVDVGKEEKTQKTKLTPLEINRRRHIVKKFHDAVNENDRTLIRVDKKLLSDPDKLRKVEFLVDEAFIVKPDDSFAKEVHYEISGVKDQFISAINNKQLGKIEELVNLYIKLGEGFLEHIAKYSGINSAEQARKERYSFSGGWEEIRWLSTDIMDIYEKAIQSRDREIIRNVAYLPIAIAKRAARENDHYLFQEFTWFAELLYEFATKENDEDLKNFLADRSWQWLKEVSDYDIEIRLRKHGLHKEEAGNLKDFAIHLFITFQSLLKKAFDNRDFGSFEKIKKAAYELFDRFQPSESTYNAEEMKLQLENTELTKHQKSETESLLEHQLMIEEIERNIKARRNQMFFGLASWILEEFLQNKNDEEVRKFYNSIETVFPSSIKELTDIFLKTNNHEVESFWGWWQWEVKEEGISWHTGFSGKLQRFYVVKSLSLVAEKSNEEVEKIAWPSSETSLTELIEILAKIKADSDDWKFILKEEAIDRVNAFETVLYEARESVREDELKIKRERKILPEEVQIFKKDLREGFYEGAKLREIFDKHLGTYKKEEAGGGKERFGINTVSDKALFFGLGEWDKRNVASWGGHYGRSFGSSESSYLLNEIIKNCNEINKKDFALTLSKFENTSDIVIFATASVTFWKFLEYSKNFKPRWYTDIEKLEVKGFGGWYNFNNQSIPVFETYSKEIKEQILILNKTKIGQLVQFSPLNEGEKKEFLEDIFYMDIQAYSENEELMREIMKNPPEWLKEVGDEQKQRKYLQERVRIKVLEKFEYRKSKDFEGYILPLKDS